MSTPVILYGTRGQPLLIHKTPWGDVLGVVEPSRAIGLFNAVTNSGVQIQSVVAVGNGLAAFVTDILLSATKKQSATVVLRFFDGTNTENIAVIDVSDAAVNIAIHPQGRTLGWNNADVQLVTDIATQVATCTVWYNLVKGDGVLSYARWNAQRGL